MTNIALHVIVLRTIGEELSVAARAITVEAVREEAV